MAKSLALKIEVKSCGKTLSVSAKWKFISHFASHDIIEQFCCVNKLSVKTTVSMQQNIH